MRVVIQHAMEEFEILSGKMPVLYNLAEINFLDRIFKNIIHNPSVYHSKAPDEGCAKHFKILLCKGNEF